MFTCYNRISAKSLANRKQKNSQGKLAANQVVFYEEQDIEHILHIFRSHDTSLHEVVWKQSDSIDHLQQKLRSMHRENKDLRNQQQELKSQLTDIQFMMQKMMKQQDVIFANSVNAVTGATPPLPPVDTSSPSASPAPMERRLNPLVRQNNSMSQSSGSFRLSINT